MRTFVFGAGASVHAEYPLTSKLGTDLVAWLARNPCADKYIAAIEMLKRLPSLEDFEQIISDLQFPTPGPQVVQVSEWERGPILDDLREALCDYFFEIEIARTNRASLYRQFAEQVVAPGDTIITFNYDVALEAELRKAAKWHLGNGYGFPLGDAVTPPTQVRILKLHGSTSWVDSILNGARDGDCVAVGPSGHLGTRPVVLPQYFRVFGYPPEVADPQFKGGGTSRQGSMILPARSKHFEPRGPFWDGLWSQAFHALHKANEIVIIGYSLPEADERARKLLFQAGNKNASVSICCGGDNARISREFRSKKFASVKADLNYFDDWLNPAH